MAEAVLAARLEEIANMKHVFLDDEEYRLCRAEAIRTYGGLLEGKSVTPTYKELDEPAALVADLSAATKRELGEALLARFADNGVSLREKITRLAESAGAGDAENTKSLDEISSEITAALRHDIPTNVRAQFATTLDSLLEFALKKVKHPKKQKEKTEKPENSSQQQYSQEAIAAYYANVAAWKEQQESQVEKAIAEAAAIVDAKAEEVEETPQPQPPRGKKRGAEFCDEGVSGTFASSASQGRKNTQPPPPPQGAKVSSAVPPPPARTAAPPPPARTSARTNVGSGGATKVTCNTCGTVQPQATECDTCGASLG